MISRKFDTQSASASAKLLPTSQRSNEVGCSSNSHYSFLLVVVTKYNMHGNPMKKGAIHVGFKEENVRVN